jgi:hypothetical protein
MLNYGENEYLEYHLRIFYGRMDDREKIKVSLIYVHSHSAQDQPYYVN